MSVRNREKRMFKIPEDVKNKYEFVTLAAKRAEQLQSGAPKRVESESAKVTVVAQEEVAADLVKLLDLEAEAAEFGEEEEEE